MRIFLIGYMGVGKTTTGRKLASKMQLPFLDMDVEFEQYYGTTVSDVIQQQGEEQFRQKEHELLQHIIQTQNDAIISTGGGAPCYFNNMELMNTAGVTLYLSAPVGALAVRLSQSKTFRPLIAGKQGEELRAIIEQMLTEREPFYCQAQITVDALNVSAEQMVNVIETLGTDN